jgi:hypothetical protein
MKVLMIAPKKFQTLKVITSNNYFFSQAEIKYNLNLKKKKKKKFFLNLKKKLY